MLIYYTFHLNENYFTIPGKTLKGCASSDNVGTCDQLMERAILPVVIENTN